MVKSIGSGPRAKSVKIKKIKSDENLLNKMKEMDIDDNASEAYTRDPRIQLVQQELKFVKTLAGNDVRIREKNLRSFREWLNLRSNSSFRK